MKPSKTQKETETSEIDDKSSDQKKKGHKSSSARQKEQVQLAAQLAAQQEASASAADQQQQNQISSQVYVKLPSSKIPDIILEDVGKLLHSKEKSTRKFVEDRMRKRKQEDNDLFFNLTDDPYNPVFDLAIPNEVSPQDAPFLSLIHI